MIPEISSTFNYLILLKPYFPLSHENVSAESGSSINKAVLDVHRKSFKEITIEALRLVNPLSANPTKWSNTQTIHRLMPTNCLSVFDQFVGLALKGLKIKGLFD